MSADPAELGELFAWRPAEEEPKGWRYKAPTRCQKLRIFMRRGEWHPYWDLVKVGGARFGARLFEIARGEDGGEPIAYECGHDPADDTLTRYRLLVRAPLTGEVGT